MKQKKTRGKYKMKIIFERKEVEDAIKCKLESMGIEVDDCDIVLSQSTATVQIKTVNTVTTKVKDVPEPDTENCAETHEPETEAEDIEKEVEPTTAQNTFGKPPSEEILPDESPTAGFGA